MKNKISLRNQMSQKMVFAVWICAVVTFVIMSFVVLLSCNNIVTWDKFAKTDFEIVSEKNQDGQDVFVALISSPEQLAGAFELANNSSAVYAESEESNLQSFFNQTTNKTFKITSSLHLGSYTWSSPDLKSGYTIDGGGYVIDGLKITSSKEVAGFVGTNNGTIKNMILSNVSISYSSSYSGSGEVQVGGIAGANKGIIENCEVSGIISGPESSTSRLVGGIVGKQYSGSITKCFNKASVSNGSHIGGIVGYADKGTINLDYNYGDVTTVSEGCVRQGGIAGEITANITFSQCYNEGFIYGYNSEENSDSAVGGIVGYCYAVVDQCYNKGLVKNGFKIINMLGIPLQTPSSLTAYTGGIVGITSADVKNCGNSGTIISGSVLRSEEKSDFTALDSSTTKKFANNVGWLWAYDLYVVSGMYKDSKGSGNYKTSTYQSKKWGSYYDNFVGGIVGKSSSNVQDCFNSGLVGTSNFSDAKTIQNYTIYFKWKANKEYHLLITENVSFDKDWRIGHIAGKCSSQSGCFFTEENFTYERSIGVSQELRNGSDTKSMELESWSKNSENKSWYLNGLGNADFNTYHNINAKSVDKIIFSAHYDGNVERDEKTIYTLKTDLSSKTWTESCGTPNTNPAIGANLSADIWVVDASINGGKPILKCFYF